MLERRFLLMAVRRAITRVFFFADFVLAISLLHGTGLPVRSGAGLIVGKNGSGGQRAAAIWPCL
jgi:hypothetical protein